MDESFDAGFPSSNQYINRSSGVDIFKSLTSSLADDPNQMDHSIDTFEPRFYRGWIENISGMNFDVRRRRSLSFARQKARHATRSKQFFDNLPAHKTGRARDKNFSQSSKQEREATQRLKPTGPSSGPVSVRVQLHQQ